MKPVGVAIVVCGVLLFNAGCHKKATVSAPLPAPPAPIAVPAATAPVRQVPAPVPAPPPPAEALPSVAQPAQPIKPSPFPPAARPSPAAARPAPVQSEAPVPTPMPSLGVILSADQKKQLDASYQSDLRQANAVLNGLNGGTLSPGQTDTVNRARAFIRQAAQYHDRDLATAAELARRAKVLTQDLAGGSK